MKIGYVILIVFVGSLLFTSLTLAESDSLTTSFVTTRTLMLLGVDTTGTNVLDTAIVNRFSRDNFIRTYTTVGVPRGKLVALVANTANYLVDAQLIYIRGVTYDSNNTFKSLRPIVIENLSDNTYYNNLSGTFNAPSWYIRHGDSMRIYPPPVMAGSVYVFYVARESYPGVNADSVYLPIEYKMALIYGTAEFCELRRKNFQRASAWHQLYLQEVGILRKRFEGMEIPLIEENK